MGSFQSYLLGGQKDPQAGPKEVDSGETSQGKGPGHSEEANDQSRSEGKNDEEGQGQGQQTKDSEQAQRGQPLENGTGSNLEEDDQQPGNGTGSHPEEDSKGSNQPEAREQQSRDSKQPQEAGAKANEGSNLRTRKIPKMLPIPKLLSRVPMSNNPTTSRNPRAAKGAMKGGSRRATRSLTRVNNQEAASSQHLRAPRSPKTVSC